VNPTWGQIASGGVGMMCFALLLWFVLKLQPSWEKVKLRDLDVREKEAQSRVEQATAIAQLATASSQMGSGIVEVSRVLENVAVEQRHATEEQRKATQMVEILQRSNNDTANLMLESVRSLIERVERSVEEKNVNA
jgi:hypothetical protein